MLTEILVDSIIEAKRQYLFEASNAQLYANPGLDITSSLEIFKLWIDTQTIDSLRDAGTYFRNNPIIVTDNIVIPKPKVEFSQIAKVSDFLIILFCVAVLVAAKGAN